MGCVHTKGEGNPVGAPERRTLLTSKPRRIVEDSTATKKETSASTKLDDTFIGSSSEEEFIEIDVLTPSPIRNDFVATDMIPSLIYPLPPTATFQRSDANTSSNNTSHIAREIGLMSRSGGTNQSLMVEALHGKIEMESERKCIGVVKEKTCDMEPLHSSVSFQTADFPFKPGSVRSNISASTIFTFAPPQSSYALDSKLAVLTEEELEGSKDNAFEHKCREAAMPEAPDIALALEHALHSVVEASEHLWNRAHSTCTGADGVLDENGEACALPRTKKTWVGGACC